MKKRKSAGLVILYKGKILLGHSTGRKPNKGYGIPKGGIEEGETKIDAAIRETYEEVGVKVNKRLIETAEYSFEYVNKKHDTYKIIYYFIVNIDKLSQIGLKKEIISKSDLQLEEIDDARFFSYKEAKELTMYTQQSLISLLLNRGLLESKTIGGESIEPNQELNPTQENIEEDTRLNKIRRFKGTIKDYKSYWDDRISKGNN
jgi:8-oxo-dGTP pyrophosphatase MutT (NUDIX family)